MFYLNLTAGIKLDQEIKDETVRLYKYDHLFFPSNMYYNCDPIPMEWLELFQDLSTFKHIYEEDKIKEQLGVPLFSNKKELDYAFKGINIHEAKKKNVDAIDDISKSS